VSSIILKGRLFTGYEIIENGELKITGNIIERVGERDSFDINKDDKVFDKENGKPSPSGRGKIFNQKYYFYLKCL